VLDIITFRMTSELMDYRLLSLIQPTKISTVAKTPEQRHVRAFTPSAGYV
jgi:hypothetical protein